MDTIALGVLWYLAFLFSTVAHEAAHAWAAVRMGDPTAYHGGQVSLDPMPHMDERLADRYRELMLQPAVSTFGLFFAWQAYGPVFRPLFRLALRCLYPGHF